MEIEKEAVLAAVKKPSPHGGWKVGELATLLELDGKGRHRLRRLLEELLDTGEVERGPGARYHLPGVDGDGGLPVSAPAGAEAARTGAIEAATGAELGQASSLKPGAVGRIRVHPAGYGFVERDDGEADVFVPARFRGSAIDGDRVRLTTWMGWKGVEGRVNEVIARGRAKLTGVVRSAGHQPYLEPDDPRIASTFGHVALDDAARGAKVGDCVVAEITRYPTGARGSELAARIVTVLGDPDDPRTEVAKVIACADIPDTFPDDTLAAAARTPQELGTSDFADRVDLRDRHFLTIDPETARDFDDAVCLEDGPGGLRLWVAVADVSHYVRPGTALDREALIRGCSVYLPDRAIPMLPRELSAQICSLNPEVDRCAMVVRLDIAEDGTIRDKAFVAAVIRSHARLDYPGVAAALAGDFRGPRARYREWAPELERLNALAKKMRDRRKLRGALDLDLPEAVVVLDDDDPRLVRDVRRSRTAPEVKQAYQLVEEFMLAANEAVASYFRERGHDCVWRVHDVPDGERLEEFAEIARGHGIDFDTSEATTPKAFQRVLAELAGKPYERALHFQLLRSLKQAAYDIVNVGHFGLASRDYLHFTSPIRRYPDLIVHRLLKFHLRRDGVPSGGAAHPAPPPKERLMIMASDCSGHERRAVAAEREVVDMYRAYYMRDRVGEEFEGQVAGVTSFGLFVDIGEPFVEGLVKLDQLGPEGFEFDNRGLKLRGRRSGMTFGLGDIVKVKVENVSVARRQIDLSLVEGGQLTERPTRDPKAKTKPRGKGPWGKEKPPRKGQWGGSKKQPEPKNGGGKRRRPRG